MKGKRVITILFIAVIAVLGVTLAGVSAQGTSECDQSPFCEVLSPSDSGSYTAPGEITKFVIKTGSSAEDKKIVFTPPGGVDANGCWEVGINGTVVGWKRLQNSNICQDPSAFEVWWIESSTNTPTNTATSTNTPTDPATFTPSPTGTIIVTSTPKFTATNTKTDVPKTQEITQTPTPQEPPLGGTDPRKSRGVIPFLAGASLILASGGFLLLRRNKAA
jgi:hypothetical protein